MFVLVETVFVDKVIMSHVLMPTPKLEVVLMYIVTNSMTTVNLMVRLATVCNLLLT